jgi:hypothetical protein
LLVRALEIEMPSHDPLNCVSSIVEKAKISGKVQGVAKVLRKAKARALNEVSVLRKAPTHR